MGLASWERNAMRAAVVGMLLLCFLGCSGRDASLEKERLEISEVRHGL